MARAAPSRHIGRPLGEGGAELGDLYWEQVDVAGAWELIAVAAALVVIVGVITAWWRRALATRRTDGTRRARRRD